MKFKLLKQEDSVYANHWINIELENWNDWEKYIISTRISGIKTDIETWWDLDECRECGVISIEHLQAYFNWITIK